MTFPTNSSNCLADTLSDDQLFSLEPYLALRKDDVIDPDKHNEDVVAAYLQGKMEAR